VKDLNTRAAEVRSSRIKIRKIPLPPLVVRRVIRTVVRQESPGLTTLTLHLPRITGQPALTRRDLELAVRESTTHILRQVGQTTIHAEPETVGIYCAAVELSAVHRLDVWVIYDALKAAYGDSSEIPEAHLTELSRQLSNQTRAYAIHEEHVEEALALVKAEGFQRELEDGAEVYTAEITYRKEREHLLLSWEKVKNDNTGNFGFHYSPYNFDSNPEKSFFEELLRHLNTHPTDVQDIYFTGALTDPKKTDFFVEYKGEDGRWHPYTPDFVIRRKDGRCLIVEVKNGQFKTSVEHDLERDRAALEPISPEGRKAVALRRWTNLNPDRLKYRLAFVREDTIPYDALQPAFDFVQQPSVAAPESEISPIIQEVAHLTGAERIYLFGSRARGDFDPDSDLDLFIVVPDPVGNRRQRQNELRRSLAAHRPHVDPWLMGRQEFEETKDIVGGLAYPATHEGRLVYDKP
jgi:type III restriction enzyme